MPTYNGRHQSKEGANRMDIVQIIIAGAAIIIVGGLLAVWFRRRQAP